LGAGLVAVEDAAGALQAQDRVGAFGGDAGEDGRILTPPP
jgi:hypothetical protein